MSAKMCFKDYIKCGDGLNTVRKKMNKKSHKGRHYGTTQPDAMNSGSNSGDGSMMMGSGPGVGVGMGESTEAFTPQFFPNLMWSYRPKNMVQTRGTHYVNQEDEYDDEGDYKNHDEDREPDEEEEETSFVRWRKDQQPDNEEHDYDIWADEEEEEMAGDMPPNDNVDPEHEEEKNYDNALNDQNDDPNEELGKRENEMGQEENQDPNRQGMIRRVPGAHLVYKRQSDEADDYNELWVYKMNDNQFKDVLSIRKQILSGTDIPRNKTMSDDGEQTSHTWTSGNVQFLEIKGLPN